MARPFEEVNEEARSAGRRLDEETKEARDAGRQLADTADDEGGADGDAHGELRALRRYIGDQQKAVNRQIRRSSDAILDALDEIKGILQDFQDDDRHAQQAALNGVNMAQKAAQEMTLRNLNEVTERNTRYIDALTQQSKRRIERLAMVTLPDRLFNFGKWTALMLTLIILCHVAWRVFMG